MCTLSSFAATNSGIQRTKRENRKAAKTTAIELEAEEKGDGIEEDCLYVHESTGKLLGRHEMRGIWWNMVAVCSGWHYDISFFKMFQGSCSGYILPSLVFSHSMGANASTASESFCSRVFLCILIPRIIHQVCKVHYTINYSQACFSCMMLNCWLWMSLNFFLPTSWELESSGITHAYMLSSRSPTWPTDHRT